MREQKGFVLIFTTIVISILMVVVGVGFQTIRQEFKTSKNEEKSWKAFYAADTGIECVRYLNETYHAFDTTSPESTYNCGIGDDFSVGFPTPTIGCVNHTYPDITVNGFSNGACTVISVRTESRIIYIGGAPVSVCDLYVISRGRNSCSAGADDIVERTRWENM